jgi:hypothetical protein
LSAHDKNFNVRLPDELIADVQRRIIDLGGQSKGFSQTSVIRTLLEEWVGGKRVVEMSPPSSATKALNDDMERLTVILEDGTPTERDSIRGVIKTVSGAVKARMSQNPSRQRSKPKPQKKAG